jgi:hypothetical protein
MVRLAGVLLLCATLAHAQTPDGGAPPVNLTPPAAVAAEPTEPPPKPLVKKPLFWITILGGVGVIAAGIGIAIALNPPHDPNATWGVGVGN